MEMTMIGPRNLTPAERKEMETIAAESQAAPDGAYRYFGHNPLDKTTLYYRSEALQQQAAAAILRSCCVDGDWDEADVAQSADVGGWRQSLAAKLADFGVELNGNALYMCCDAGQFSHKFGDYLHALLVVAGPAFTFTSETEEQL